LEPFVFASIESQNARGYEMDHIRNKKYTKCRITRRQKIWWVQHSLFPEPKEANVAHRNAVHTTFTKELGK